METPNILRRTSGSLRKERERKNVERRKERENAQRRKERENTRRNVERRKEKEKKTKNRKPHWVRGGGTIIFSRFDYPTPPSYLGETKSTTCGYSYDHCRTGMMVYSERFAAFPVKDVFLSRLYTTLFCFKHHPILNRMGDEKRIIASYLKHATLSLENCRWLEKLVKLSKNRDNRPSETHFPIVLWGDQMGKFKCNTARYTSRNPQTPVPLEAWWTNRWPTHEEAMILKEHFGNFIMGKPQKIHLHGN